VAGALRNPDLPRGFSTGRLPRLRLLERKNLLMISIKDVLVSRFFTGKNVEETSKKLSYTRALAWQLAVQ